MAAARRALTTAQINDGIAADQTQDAIDKRDEQIADLEEQIEEIKAALPSVEDIQKRVELAELEYNLNKKVVSTEN